MKPGRGNRPTAVMGVTTECGGDRYDNYTQKCAWSNLTLSWTYDSFGNRTAQTPQIPSGEKVLAPVPQAQTLNYPSQNHISNYGSGGYDGAGNVQYDLVNNYLYD